MKENGRNKQEIHTEIQKERHHEKKRKWNDINQQERKMYLYFQKMAR